MPVICWRFYVWEAISFQQHVKGVTCCCSWIVLEQIEKIVVTEILVEVVLGAAAVVYCCQGHRFLVNLTTVNFLLYGTYSQKSVNNHVSFLADSKYTIYGLVIVGWVPVRIKYYCSISPSKVQALAANLGSE